MREAKLSERADPYICRMCRRVYAHLDLMGDPGCECGNDTFAPVLLSEQLARLIDTAGEARTHDPLP